MRTARTLLIVFSCMLLAPAGADAAVTIGPADPNPNPPSTQAAPWINGTLLFTTAGPPGTVLSTPAEGVITSWRVYTDDVNGEATAQLYALTPAGGDKYSVSAAGPKQPLPAGKAEGANDHNLLHAFSTRVPVGAGVMLGVRFEEVGSLYASPVLSVGTGLALGYFGGVGPAVPADGGIGEPAKYNEASLAMNATLEPDVDHDGYGDETQDKCPGVADPCVAPISTITPPVAKKKCRKGKKLKHGKCVKKKKKHHRHGKRHNGKAPGR